MININGDRSNDDGQQPTTIPECSCFSQEEQLPMRDREDPLLSTHIDCQPETITNMNNDLIDDRQNNTENNSITITNLSDSNSLLVSSAPLLISVSRPSSAISATKENKTIEHLPKEKEEKKEEQQGDDDYKADEEKKNNSSFINDYHASRILVRNVPYRYCISRNSFVFIDTPLSSCTTIVDDKRIHLS